MNTWTNALENALEAAARGYAVFPISVNKIPSIRSPHQRGHKCPGMHACGAAGHGVGDATTEPDLIEFLFDQAPRAAGYGVACGQKLIGLDLDRKNGVDGVATLKQLGAEHGFEVPRTMTVCTPSGGFHLWFTVPAGTVVPNSVGRVGPGIDVRSTRGYLVGPGSRGKAGTYAVHPSCRDAAVLPIPAPLLRAVMPVQAPAPPRRTMTPHRSHTGALDGLVRVVLEAKEGNRNSALYWAACRSWAHVEDGHLASSDAEHALLAAASSIGLSETEAHRTIASARRTSTRSQIRTEAGQ